MSLLLLFPSSGGTGFCWHDATTGTLPWVNSHYDFKNIWDEWQTYTWGQVETAGYTWAYLAGQTFTVTNNAAGTWTLVSVPVENCST